MLKKLYNDERSQRVDIHYILDDMFHLKFISKATIDKFQPHLKEHQLAETGDGENILTKAILEHNI